MIKKKIILFFLILTYHFVNAQSITVDIQNESYLKLVGSTNIASFNLIQKGDKIPNKRFVIPVSQNKGQIILGQNQLSLSILNFSSDNPIAYHDFVQLLKVKLYPQLFVQLQNLTLQPEGNKPATTLSGNASVAITITGVTKNYMIPFTSTRNGDIVTVEGTHKMNIRDFGLVPPTKMMGLVRTSEMVDIKFHFIFKVNNRELM
ncbi:MAG: hypothetical protein Q8908_08290 [Bacteroidota bacterium]|nr:hypothetical protein [Bacteroidota bacterium]